MNNYRMLFILLLINASQVNATVFTGNMAGSFSGTAIATSLEWGVGFDGKSSLKFNGTNFSTNDNTSFKVATLTYKNTAITFDTSFSNVFTNMGLGLLMNLPSSSPIVSVGFNYDLTVEETPNNSSTPSDIVTLLPVNNFNPTFTLSGQNFSFELLGFSNGSGGFNNSFTQAEGSSSPVDLYAKISAVPVPSAIWLFLTALTGFFIAGNRKRS